MRQMRPSILNGPVVILDQSSISFLIPVLVERARPTVLDALRPHLERATCVWKSLISDLDLSECQEVSDPVSRW